MTIYATQQELDDALVYWQPRLMLADWNLRVQLVSAGQAQNLSNSGHVIGNDNKMAATIQIIRHDDISDVLCDPNIQANDQEATLVHELIHLHWVLCEPSNKDAVKWALYERSVDQLARAIVGIKREAQRAEKAGAK